MIFDESLKSLKADDEVVKAQLQQSEPLVGKNSDLTSIINDGKVAKIMVNDAEKASVETRLQSRGLPIYGNHKVPRGMAAVYDKDEKLIGFYRLAA